MTASRFLESAADRNVLRKEPAVASATDATEGVKGGSQTELRQVYDTNPLAVPAGAEELPIPGAVADLLGSLGRGDLSAAAYDTAFAARVREVNDRNALAYPQTLSWLLRNQNPDGSYGTTLPVPKERLIATLGAVLALADLPVALQDGPAHRARLRALTYLHEGTGKWQTGPDTAGFELILPALLAEAKARDLPIPYERFLGVIAQRDAKLGHIPSRLIYNVDTPLLHSLEYLGRDLDVEAIRNRIAPNGSLANSPSATAFFLQHGEDERAREYLSLLARRRGDGGFPVCDPFEVFELAWVLYNLARAGYRPQAAMPHLRYLASALTEDGVGISRQGLRADGDDTALTLMVLHQYGYPISMGPLRSFEGVNFFMTFPLERDPSVATNAHALEALQASPQFSRQHLVQQKVIKFLRDVRVDGDHWVDKWHSSPFYATAHAVFALLAPAPDLCRPALKWLQDSQRSDGSWGWSSEGTAEETACVVQAWLAAPAHLKEGLRVDLSGAERFLEDAEGSAMSPQWIGKSLYMPVNVVRSAVLSARIMLLRGGRNAG